MKIKVSFQDENMQKILGFVFWGATGILWEIYCILWMCKKFYTNIRLFYLMRQHCSFLMRRNMR